MQLTQRVHSHILKHDKYRVWHKKTNKTSLILWRRTSSFSECT